MENYSLFMGAAAVMKMAVEMAAVSMEEPSGGLPRPAGCRNRDSVPQILASRWRRLWKVLSRFGYADCKSSLTPYDPSVLLRKNEKATKDQLRYSQIIGSLMYLACATRPDISFAVCKLSRFVANPGDDHWHALERVMRYLKGTMSYGIHYTGYPKGLEGYSDSNWISDAKMKATSGYVFTLGGGAVSWKSCKQTILTSMHHLVTLVLHTSLSRLDAALDDFVHHTGQASDAQTRPDMHTHARACTGTLQNAPDHVVAPLAPLTPPLLSAPLASQRHQQSQGHAHWPAGTLCTTPPSTTSATACELTSRARPRLALVFTAITSGVTVVTSPSDERQRQCSGAAVATSP
ncbi:hypothetical protein QYE76_029525 [Lolium multiflorum]|uniref:Uncharacterized protein n=1 Tax=Lolium multiflorum TaxID=4521 RepID=A0AAD8VFL6_LOLMU|nr:hypothetical protein QYE76_029525 [Lolium multiflorum]